MEKFCPILAVVDDGKTLTVEVPASLEGVIKNNSDPVIKSKGSKRHSKGTLKKDFFINAPSSRATYYCMRLVVNICYFSFKRSVFFSASITGL